MAGRRAHPLAAFFQSEEPRFLMLAALVGVGGAIVGVAFQFAIQQISDCAFGSTSGNVLAAGRTAPGWRRLLVPMAGGGLAALVLWAGSRLLAVPARGGAGIPDVMEMLVRRDRVPTVRAAVRGALAALVGIGTGASAGREGPMCALATALAARVGTWMRLSRERYQSLVVAGVAAGLAAAYNAPLGAAVFALEVLVRWDQRYLLPCAVAATTGAGATHLFGRAQPLYPEGAALTLDLGNAWWEIPVVLALAALGGLAAAGFQHALNATGRLVKRLSLPTPVALVLGGAVVGALALRWPEVYGNGYEAARGLLAPGTGEAAATLALAALAVGVVKALGTAASIGTGLPGGVFTPTLVIGAALGAAVGHAAAAIAPPGTVSPGLHAVVGMATVLAGTTRAPVLSVVMLAELTGNWGVVLWLILPVFVAVSTAHWAFRDSIYEIELHRRGVDWVGAMAETALRSLRVQDVMRRDVPLLPADLPAKEVVRIFAETRRPFLFVADRAGTFLGAIEMQDLQSLYACDPRDLETLVLAQDLVQPIPAVYPDESLVSVNEKLWFRDLGHLPVLESPTTPRFLGIVTRRDLLGAIDHQILQRDAFLTHAGAPHGGEARFVELPPEHRLEEVPIPSALDGQVAGALDWRGRFGLTLLAVVRLDPQGRERRAVPDGGWRFQRGDRVVVLGRAADIRRLRGEGDGAR